MSKVNCKDCLAEGVTTVRPTPYGGPRSPLCVTHWRARRKHTSKRNYERRVEKKFEITPSERQAILDAQNGLCFVCRRARDDRSHRLCVDHEHNKPGCDHPPDVGCRKCVRCLACQTCNRVVLGRYSVEALQRAIEVLTCPPAQRILNSKKGQTRGSTLKVESFDSTVKEVGYGDQRAG
jgi:hypothetical protein